MIINLLDQIIGTLPSYVSQQTDPSQYYAIVRYVIAGCVLMFLLSLMYRFFVAVFGRWIR